MQGGRSAWRRQQIVGVFVDVDSYHRHGAVDQRGGDGMDMDMEMNMDMRTYQGFVRCHCRATTESTVVDYSSLDE